MIKVNFKFKFSDPACCDVNEKDRFLEREMVDFEVATIGNIRKITSLYALPSANLILGALERAY